jgi:hypothetical protein
MGGEEAWIAVADEEPPVGWAVAVMDAARPQLIAEAVWTGEVWTTPDGQPCPLDHRGNDFSPSR